MQFPSFCGGDYRWPDRVVDQETTINLICERRESPGADSRLDMIAIPGVTLVGTALSSPGRGHFYEDDREFAVIGTSFVEIDEAGTITVRGTVAADSNPAQIRSNGDGGGQLLIVSGTNGYSYDLDTDVLTQVSALDGKASQAAFLDGYGLVLNSAASTWYFSDLLDFLTWTTGTDFEQRSKSSDPWKAIATNGPYIFLPGTQTGESWYDAGASANPFAPDPSGQIPYGIAAQFSLAVGEGSLFWLAQSAIGQRYAVRATGFSPQVISTLPLQATFQSYDIVSDTVGEVINYQGHTLYVLTFPSEDITWAYDLSTELWFQLGTWYSESNKFSAWRPRWHAMAFGEHRMLDSQTGAIYKLDPDSHTDVNDRPVVWERRPPTISSENERLFHQRLEMNIQTGVGLASGDAQDTNPQVMMQYSNDGGANWSAERWRSMGLIGQYAKPVEWWQLGSAKRRAYRFRGSGAVRTVISGAFIELGQQPRTLRRTA